MQQELYKDKTSDGKLEFVMKDDFYSLTILNPCVNDMGKYTLVVKDGKETYHTGAYLDVKGTKIVQTNYDRSNISFVESIFYLNNHPFLYISSAKDPEFFFKKKLKEKDTGYINRSLKLKCILNSADAKISWQKGTTKIPVSVFDVSLILIN